MIECISRGGFEFEGRGEGCRGGGGGVTLEEKVKEFCLFRELVIKLSLKVENHHFGLFGNCGFAIVQVLSQFSDGGFVIFKVLCEGKYLLL